MCAFKSRLISIHVKNISWVTSLFPVLDFLFICYYIYSDQYGL